jgi:nucleotide-binding universal stress UspA family protein
MGLKLNDSSGGKQMASFAKILFPTDFSKGADHAFENVMCLPGVREVIVQHVVSTYFEKHSHWTTLFDIHEMQKYMEMYVQTEMSTLTSKKIQGTVSYRTVVSEGKSAQQIVELADKEKVDVIVMGPAKGVVRRWFVSDRRLCT